ncbi:MAG: DUF1893 domain-containing protein [bacterium]|nr:DUF1893 domain-containing protein [bacterium]
MKKFLAGIFCSFLLFSAANAIELSQEIIDKASNPENAIAIYKDGDVFVSSDKSLRPILTYLEENGTMKGAFAFDRTVGKAEALLYVYGKAKFVYGETMSIPAEKILIRHRIQHKAGKLVGEILIPDNTDVRPCDKAVVKIKKAKDAYLLFSQGNGALD